MADGVPVLVSHGDTPGRPGGPGGRAARSRAKSGSLEGGSRDEIRSFASGQGRARLQRRYLRQGCSAADGRFPGSCQATAYYIAAEAFTNAPKYAEASAVDIVIERSGIVIHLPARCEPAEDCVLAWAAPPGRGPARGGFRRSVTPSVAPPGALVVPAGGYRCRSCRRAWRHRVSQLRGDGLLRRPAQRAGRRAVAARRSSAVR